MTRKTSWRLRALSLGILAVVGVTAFTGASAARDRRAGTTNIVLWEAGGPLYVKAIRPVIRAYEKAFPNVTVTVQPVDWGTFEQRVLTAGAAGQLPCVMYSNSQVESAIAAANVMTQVPTSIITKTQLKQYLPGFTQGLTDVNGRLLFVPFLGGANQFYFRIDTPAGKKPPVTYSDWVTYGKKAVRRDSSGAITREGIGWRFAPQIPGVLTSQFASMVIAAGGQFLNNGNGPLASKALFNSAAGLKVLQFMQDTIYKYKISNPPNKQTYNQQNPVLGFLSNKEASDYLGPWLPNALATLATGPYAEIAKVWDATNLAPKPDTGGKNIAMISTDGWGVPKSCPNQTLAWNFIKFMTTPVSYQTFFAIYQHPVARVDAMTSRQAASVLRKYYPSAKHELEIWTNPALEKVSVSEVHHPSNADIFKAVETSIIRAMDDQNANLQQTLSSMASQVDTILARKR
jgi:ABC-type glycerol-3-phosphate transport system substrate-binding protein